MITREKFEFMKSKYGDFSSWSVWKKENPDKPTSNIGDLDVLDPDNNKDLLSILNPNVILVGLNISRGSVKNNEVDILKLSSIDNMLFPSIQVDNSFFHSISDSCKFLWNQSSKNILVIDGCIDVLIILNNQSILRSLSDSFEKEMNTFFLVL